MGIQVFVAKRDPEDPLSHKVADAVVDAARVAMIGEAAREAVEEADSSIDFVEEYAAAV